MEDNKCSRCKHNTPEGVLVCDGCIHDQSLKDRFEPMTNGDRIRAMTDEELAEFLGDVDCCNPNHCEPGMYCGRCWLNWLKAPVEDGDE